jgi:ribosomal protein L37E
LADVRHRHPVLDELLQRPIGRRAFNQPSVSCSATAMPSRERRPKWSRKF